MKRSPFAMLLVAACFFGCAKENPGLWGKDKVEAQVKKSLELDEVSLEPRTEGGFSGSGKREKETIQVTVKQDAASSRMEWDAKGDRGFVEQGYYELK